MGWGGDVTDVDAQKRTPLHYAALSGCLVRERKKERERERRKKKERGKEGKREREKEREITFVLLCYVTESCYIFNQQEIRECECCRF
jgi:hypothetical protein